MTRVFVITNVESGWDCVMGVYYKKEDAIKYCAEMDGDIPVEDWNEGDSRYIIHEKSIK